MPEIRGRYEVLYPTSSKGQELGGAATQKVVGD